MFIQRTGHNATFYGFDTPIVAESLFFALFVGGKVQALQLHAPLTNPSKGCRIQRANLATHLNERREKMQDNSIAEELNALLERQRGREQKRSKEAAKERAKHEAMVRSSLLRTQEMLRGKVQQATREDYQKWLKGFLLSGGEITHTYEYPMSRVLDSWFVALQDFTLTPLYGSNSLHVIVQEGVKFLGEESELGHSALHFIDGFKKSQGAIVPIYSDICFK